VMLYKHICTTSHQQKHLYNITSHQERTSVQHHTSKYICTASHQQKNICNITPANTHLYNTTPGVMLYICCCWCGVVHVVFAGVVMYRWFCWCDICTDVFAGVVLYRC
jgi:hypothetical protein